MCTPVTHVSWVPNPPFHTSLCVGMSQGLKCRVPNIWYVCLPNIWYVRLPIDMLASHQCVVHVTCEFVNKEKGKLGKTNECTYIQVKMKMWCITHVCDMIHSCAWHDSFIYVSDIRVWGTHTLTHTHAHAHAHTQILEYEVRAQTDTQTHRHTDTHSDTRG